MNKKNQNPIKVGLIGLGKMGINHLRNLSIMKQVEVEFVYDINPNSYQDVLEKFSVRLSADLTQDLPKVDAVIIVTPTTTHYDYIKLTSEYVKCIFVEKPLSDSVATDQKIIHLAREKDLKIQVGFIERYNPAVRSLKKLLTGQKIINMEFSRTSKVSRITDADVVLDLMIHDIDLAIYFSGAIESVSAFGYLQNDLIEFAQAIFKHSNGTFSTIVSSRVSDKRIRHISATCKDLYADCNLLKRSVKFTKTQELPNGGFASTEQSVAVQPEEGLLLELLDFTKLCLDQQVSVPDEYVGLTANEVAQTVKIAILEQRTITKKVSQAVN